MELVILAVNDPPRTVDDSAATAEDGRVLIDVLGNDQDVEDGMDPASARVVREAALGLLPVGPSLARYTRKPRAHRRTRDRHRSW